MEYALVLGSVLCSSSAMILFKKAAVNTDLSSDLKTCAMSFLNPYFIISGLFFISSVLMYLTALSELDMGIAFSFTSLNYVFIMAGASLFLGEKINFYHLFGALLIMLGLFAFHMP